MNPIINAIANDKNIAAEFRAALPVGHTPLELELLDALKRLEGHVKTRNYWAIENAFDDYGYAHAAILKATT